MDHKTTNELITLLKQGPQHIQHLSQQLKLSSETINDLIKILTHLGLAIDINTNGQFVLGEQISLIDKEKFNTLLASYELQNKHELHLLSTVDSTNAHLKQKAIELDKIQICFAEHQSAGRGRRGKQWHSPFACNIYLSLSKRCYIPSAQLGWVSLVVGLSVIDALQSLGLNTAKIKWPNDIIVNNKKLAGILIETAGINSEYADLIIGVGINVGMQSDQAKEIDQSWVALEQVLKKTVCRTELSANLINQIVKNLQALEDNSYTQFAGRWKQMDYLANKVVNISGEQALSGMAKGVNEYGQLLIETPNGIHCVNSGEVSVRPATVES